MKECPSKKDIEQNGWDMDYCIHCNGRGKYNRCLYLEEKPIDTAIKRAELHKIPTKQTQFDRIKNMSVEEMAEERLGLSVDEYERGFTSDGKEFYADDKQSYESALKHEQEWLESEVE